MIVKSAAARLFALASFATFATGCVDTTGSGLVTFSSYASGDPRFVDGGPLTFKGSHGFTITLTRARMHVGAIYLNRSVPIPGAQSTSCVLPGIYVAEAIAPEGSAGLDVDALSPTPQPFPGVGNGTADHAASGEVWLTGGPVDEAEDATTIVDVEGTATNATTTYHFTGKLHIGSNWKSPPLDATQPGSNPICKQRIASPIPVDVLPQEGGALYLAIDPRAWFGSIDFSELAPVGSDPTDVAFADAPTDAPSRSLFQAIHAYKGVYSMSWK